MIGATACADEEHAISVETVELASGEYYGLSWGGTQVERFHVLAHSGTRDGEIVIASPELATPCSLGRLATYLPLRPMNAGNYVLGSPSPARVALFETLESGRGALGFATLDCERMPFAVPDAAPSELWRLYSRDLMSLDWAVRSGDGTLRFVDPWDETQSVIAHGVTRVQPYQDGLWLVEDGRLVNRDSEGKKLATYGQDVREFALLGRNGGDEYMLLVDQRGLVVRREGKERVMEPDACGVFPVSGFGSRALAYFSPCAERRLTVRKEDGTTYSYAEGVAMVIPLDGRLLFTVDGEQSTTFYLVMGRAPEEAVMLGQGPRVSLDSLWPTANGYMFVTRLRDGSGLALVEVTESKDAYDFRVIDDGIASLRAQDSALAVLKTDGTLSLRTRSNMREFMRVHGVKDSGYRFVFDGDSSALAYLSDLDDKGLGRLQLYFLTGAHFEIARDVREFTPVWWPEQGLLYAQSGPVPGMRFARVKVPCELSSDSPWACGF